MVIPKEEAQGFQRWEFGDLGRKPVQEKISETPPQIVDAVPDETTEQTPVAQFPTAEELERIFEEARKNGYETGLAEAKAEFQASMDETTADQAQQFGQLINSLSHALGEIDQSVAEQLLALAIETANQVCQGSIAVKDDVLLPIIREAITLLPVHHAHISLRLNPGDVENIRKHLGEQFSQAGTQIIEDDTISLGGCQVQAGPSEIDATIETRWKRVLEAIGAEPQAWLTT